MKERVTLIVPETGQDIDPSRIAFNNDSSIDILDAEHVSTLQHRLTFDLAELPLELQDDLKATDELHIRWRSTTNIEITTKSKDNPPFNSRIPSGIHIFHKENGSGGNLCHSLMRVFGINCTSVADSFSIPLPEKSPSLHQYYREFTRMRRFYNYTTAYVCNGEEHCDRMPNETPDSIDFDYDSASRTFSVNTQYNRAPEFYYHPLKRHSEDDRLEIGIFKEQPHNVQGEVKLGGYLVDVGVHEKPSATMFDFPSRHLTAGPPISLGFEQPTGLHPRFNIRFKPSRPLLKDCSLHAYFTLPSAIFIDRYQFSDPVALAAQNLVGLRSLTGEDDLEAPNWVVKKWGSAALFDIAVPQAALKNNLEGWNVTIPMHLRYVAANDTDFVDLLVPDPTIFWACEETNPEVDLANNPFDRLHLGYDHHFPANTRFHHIEVMPKWDAFETIKVPVLDKSANSWVPLGTLLAVLLGFAWICWKLLTPQEQQKVVNKTENGKVVEAQEKKD